VQNIDDWLKNASAGVAGGLSPGTPNSGPATIIITAADLPVDPSTLIGASPESLYVIRTAAGLVPPASGQTDLSVAAALEYGIRVRKARHIIQIAHNDCGILKSLVDPDASGTAALLQCQFLPQWVALASSSISGTIQGTDETTRAQQCAEELLRVGFENLMTYPWILDPVWNGQLGLHGWYIDRHAKRLRVFSPETDSFREV